MPKDLALQEINGSIGHVLRGTNTIFEGHVSRDLEVGDVYEQLDEEGFVRKMKVKSKEITHDGYTIVVSDEVIV
jgi:ribosomal protein S19E (S16A)